jgi:cytochrome c nitrite reductase small subunit
MFHDPLRTLTLAVLIGVVTGVGAFTFRYAEGFSYFKTDPEACANCHIMRPQLDSYRKSSHHAVAVCVDCHLPHDVLPKYIAKGDNGYRHSKGFTFQDFPEPIRIGERNGRILQENCLRCHAALVHDLAVRCVHCHAGVGHGEPAGMGTYERSL